MNEVIREFLLETHENLAQLDLDLVQLEQDPGSTETIARVFRTLHTVKGTAGFLGLPKLQAVAHAAENLLTRLRAGEMAYSPVIASSLLGAVDAIRKMLDALEKTETEGDHDFTAVIASLETLLTAGMAGPAHVAVPQVVPMSAPPPAPLPPPVPVPLPVLTSSHAQVSAGEPALSAIEKPASLSPPSLVIAESTELRSTAVSDSALRVDVGLLDKLMTLVGELVLARNQILQFSATQEESSFLGTVQRLNLLTTELQASVMKTRMQPIGNMWSKFPRVVRDLAVACGKQVHLEMEGKETELDKTIVEAIRDPLTHLVRNAVDHGIESPSERMANGKPVEGRLALQASHEGGQIIIKIVDDGRGMDPRRVRDKAISAKLITSEQAARMSEREITELIFLPGFSTTDKVTNFSGRGVGMDVVRTNVEKIGGTVDVDSKPGHGTTLKLKIPLTLAIIPALTISSGGDRYAIPQVNLLELVRLEGERALQGIEWIHHAAVYRLRGNLLPLVYLNQQLQVEDTGSNGEINIVVLQADDRQFGLIVDAIHDTEEIVVKPLQQQTQGISVFSGATIMGDGKVALILDVLGIAQQAHVISGLRDRAKPEKASATEAVVKETVLLFATGSGDRMAVPLSSVARLEEFSRSALERVGHRYVVQYRGQILPLLDVGEALGRKNKNMSSAAHTDSSLPVQVVVYTGPDQLLGLIVEQILDIVEEAIVTKSNTRRPGVLYTAVVQEKVTEFLDVEGLLQAVDRDCFDSIPGGV